MSDEHGAADGSNGLFGHVDGAVGDVGKSAFGHSHGVGPFGPKPNIVGGWAFPPIEPGVATTLVMVPFPVTSTGPPPKQVLVEDAQVAAVLAMAVFLWILPALCINQKCCCRCWKRFMSRRITAYFFICLVLNGILVGTVLASCPDIDANDLFFAAVNLVGKLADNLENVLNQAVVICGIGAAYMFRHRIMMILGYDQHLIRADVRDVLTCFTMHRFKPVELSIWKIEDLPSSGFGSRSLFVRVVCGYNEALHTRPHDGCNTAANVKERMQLNYDEYDDTQKLSLVVKQQEVVGGAVSQLAPVAGVVVGAAAGLMSIGPAAGAGLGAVTGVGAANSLGKEIARVDLSSMQINRLRELATPQTSAALMSTGPAFSWKEDFFKRVDLVPQGCAYIRIADVEQV